MSTKRKVGTNAWSKMQRNILESRVKRADPPILNLHYRNIMRPDGLISLWPQDVRERMEVMVQSVGITDVTVQHSYSTEPQSIRGIMIKNQGV